MTLERGKTLGAWTLIEYRAGRWEADGTNSGRCVTKPAWKCSCKCGTVRWVQASNLRSGQSKGCGCAYQGQWKSKNLRAVNSVFALAPVMRHVRGGM